MTSPAGRIEVFQPIPPPDGRSPEGPHTHLLPKLIGKGPHSANTPLPAPLRARIVLRRLAAKGNEAALAWQVVHDHAAVEADD